MVEPRGGSDLEPPKRWLLTWREFAICVERRLQAGDISDDFPWRVLMGILYKDYLSPARQEEFAELFRTVPTVTHDYVEMERQRAWKRRRHLVAFWHQ